MANWSNTRENRVFGGMYSLGVRVRTTNRTLGTTPGDEKLLDTYIASKAPDALSKAEELANTYVPDPGVENIPDEDKNRMITLFPRGKFLRDKNDPTVFYDPLYDVVPDGVSVEEVVVPFIWDYQLRGSFKESIAFIQRASKAKKTAAKSKKAEEPKTEEGGAEETPKKRGRKKTAAMETAEAAVTEALQAGTKFACTNITAYKKVVDGGWFIKQRRVPMLIPDTYIDDLGVEHNTYDEHGRLPIWTRALRADTAQGPRVCLATSEFVPAGTEYYFTVQLLNAKDKDAMIETLDFKQKVGMLQWRGGGNGTFIWTPADKDGHPTDEKI